ncbi:MAG: hypothetical protein AAGU05_10060 [Anaerolineaceae bacterium]
MENIFIQAYLLFPRMVYTLARLLHYWKTLLPRTMRKIRKELLPAAGN